MPDQIDPSVQQDRLERLIAVQTPICKQKNLPLEGKRVKVFAERVSKNNPNFYSGHTQGGKKVDFKAEQDVCGQIVEVEITKAKTWFLEGKMI